MSDLPWSFEAFRRFLTYEVMQQAAATLLSYENTNLLVNTHLMNEFSHRLQLRTGLEWSPNRVVSEGVMFNTEGSIFRNKARVFTSFYLINPISFDDKNNLVLSDFSKALGLGQISEKQFYEFIVSRYKYPHPAYSDNWEKWTEANTELRPFIFILDILLSLYKKNPNEGHISSKEFVHYAVQNPLHSKVSDISSSILSARDRNEKIQNESNIIGRKITDIFAFLCISGLTFYKDNSIYLNLLDRHDSEMTHFWEKRNAQDYTQNRLEDIQSLIESSKNYGK